jgi:hypothetical protein
MVLLDEHTGRYWQLNGTGALVLGALLDGLTSQQTALRLRELHPALPAEQADDDVIKLLGSLHAARLVAP